LNGDRTRSYINDSRFTTLTMLYIVETCHSTNFYWNNCHSSNGPRRMNNNNTTIVGYAHTVPMSCNALAICLRLMYISCVGEVPWNRSLNLHGDIISFSKSKKKCLISAREASLKYFFCPQSCLNFTTCTRKSYCHMYGKFLRNDIFHPVIISCSFPFTCSYLKQLF
jgi:hypothetical protein